MLKELYGMERSFGMSVINTAKLMMNPLIILKMTMDMTFLYQFGLVNKNRLYNEYKRIS